MAKKALLMILDGWGMGNHGKGDVIFNTPTPYMDYLAQNYPMSQLQASGENVGLPDGQMGNSEVGHLNIGAGRIVYQDLVKINRACADGSILKNPEIVSAYEYAKQNGKSVHLMGLTSTGGVHSSLDHLFTLCGISKTYGIEHTYVHCFMDGRDTDPKSGKGFIEQLQAECEKTGCVIASIIGRFYAMDRDKRWERVERAWKAMVRGEGEKVDDVIAAMHASYDNDVTDEFIVPMVCIGDEGRIHENDGIIFYNFRADRAKQLSRSFVDPSFDGFDRGDWQSIELISMTEYDASLNDMLTVAYPPLELTNTLGEWLAKQNKTQLRTAETEKYAHVTSFFNGGVEAPNDKEERVLIPSPKVATYDLQPEMSAEAVADTVVKGVESGKYDFILVNFANPDMVGHTGVLSAAIQAMEAVDVAVGRVVDAVAAANGKLLICADHGNCEKMANEDGSPFTSHTTNPVPVILFGDERTLHDGRLSDVAPTVLALMELDQPAEMTGSSLLND